MENFTKRAGDSMLQSTDDPSMALIGDTTPDTVRLPAELGGHMVPVTGAFMAPCPTCKSGRVKHLKLGTDGLGVAECADDVELPEADSELGAAINRGEVPRSIAKQAAAIRIIVRYESIDRVSKTRTFKTLKGARRFAQHWVGETPDFGSSYAVSHDGIGKVTVFGARLHDLFPAIGEP